MLKKILVCGGIILALGMCASGCSSSPVDRCRDLHSTSIVERKNAVPVQDNFQLPTVDFVYDGMMDSVAFIDSVTVERADTVYLFYDYGFYYLASANLKYDVDGVSFTSLTFYRYTTPPSTFFYTYGYQAFYTPWIYFGRVSVSGEISYACPKSMENISKGMQTADLISQRDEGSWPYVYHNWFYLYADENYLFYPSSQQWNNYFDAVVANRLLSLYDVDGIYQDGKAAGEADGYERGKRDGYAQYENETFEDGFLFPHLFGAVLSVPFSVLDGLGGFVFFGTPLIAIPISLLFAAAVFWFIRKLI